MVRGTRLSLTARQKLAASEARSISSPRCSAVWTRFITAVFSPEKLISYGIPSTWPMGRVYFRSSPPWERSSSGFPPGYGRPSTRAVLSKHSPAASSLVAPRTRMSVYPRTSTSMVFPPEMARQRKGGSSSGKAR